MNGAIIDFGKAGGCVVEISLMNIQTSALQHWTFKPSPERIDSEWNDDLKTLIPEGDIDNEYISEILCKALQNFKFVFAETQEKCDFLSSLLLQDRMIFNLQYFNPTPVIFLEHVSGSECIYHTETTEATACTKSRVTRMGNWCRENHTKINLFDYTPRLKTFRGWKCAIKSPEELARNLFVYTPNNVKEDCVSCIMCNIKFSEFREDVSIMTLHKKYNKDCAQFYPLTNNEDV
jgi:hypothetical protein